MSKLIIFGSAAIAIYLITKQEGNFFDDENEDFRAGYTAGFLTPGPFTILALAGLATTAVSL